jgi:hypothetical protein
MLHRLNAVVVSDEEKALVEASGRDQEGERKRIAAEVSKRNETASKLGQWGCSKTSLAGARRLARRCPAWRRREPGLRLSRGTWEGLSRHCHPGREVLVATGSAASGWDRKALSTVAGQAGGPAHSSEEAPVMGVEPRGRVARGGVRSINRTSCPGGVVWTS